MKISEVKASKKAYMNLLLLVGGQEDMIGRYLERGTKYVLDDDGVKAECVVTDEGDGVMEIKNIAVKPSYQNRGYGKYLVEFIINRYAERYNILSMGTGDSPLTVPFYEQGGFQRSHIIKNFFIDNYDHSVFEAGKQLVDMVYYEKKPVE